MGQKNYLSLSMYFISTPFWLKWMYPKCTWDKSSVGNKVLYLTFDDGPHPLATPFVLDWLGKYNAKASFFCIGNNVEKHPAIYDTVIEEGHLVGNHTFHHMKGWGNTTLDYMEEIQRASRCIKSDYFRPPYGRITRAQIKGIQKDTSLPQQIIMWDVLSGDFDLSLTGDHCATNVIEHARSGSIIVFHDSQKAWDRLHIALPKILEHFTQLGYTFKRLDQ
jgi:peptidoglycan/xylan/chitin deacetylase (PgdA/CDA1 family)